MVAPRRAPGWGPGLAGGITVGVMAAVFGELGPWFAIVQGGLFAAVWIALSVWTTRRQRGGSDEP